jgi:hypothetical protein
MVIREGKAVFQKIEGFHEVLQNEVALLFDPDIAEDAH